MGFRDLRPAEKLFWSTGGAWGVLRAGGSDAAVAELEVVEGEVALRVVRIGSNEFSVNGPEVRSPGVYPLLRG